MDAPNLALTGYLSPPSSVIPAQDNVKPIVDGYFNKYPVTIDNTISTTNAFPTIGSLVSVLRKLQDKEKLFAKDWIVRAKQFIYAGVPELAAFDAHKAYLLSDGIYEGPLMEPIEDEETSKKKDKAVLVLSRALFLAGCYAESHLLILHKASSSFHAQFDETDEHLDALFTPSDEARDAATMQYRDTSVDTTEIADSLLPPALRDGSVRVVKYPFIPKELLYFSEATITSLNQELARISNSRCIIQPQCILDPTHFQWHVEKFGVFADREFLQDQELFRENNTVVAAKMHDTGLGSTCKYCHHDAPEQDRPYRVKDRFCSDECFSKFTRLIRVPEDLLASYLQKAIDHVKQTEGREHPLKCPEIACLAADYGSTMSLSYDRHVAKAIDVLRDAWVDVFVNETLDSAVVMNILARVQHNAFAFNVNEDTAMAAVFPIAGIINAGQEANVVVECVKEGNGGQVIIKAKRVLKEGEELLLGPA